jgi:hypothetical protein
VLLLAIGRHFTGGVNPLRPARLGFFFGKEAGGLSASTIARLKDAWSDERRCATAPCAPRDVSNRIALAMIYKVAEAAEKSWRRLDGHDQLPKVILGVRFTDGIEVVRSQAQAAAA